MPHTSARQMSARSALIHTSFTSIPIISGIGGVLLLSVFILYYPGHSGPWIFDDFVNVVDTTPKQKSIFEIARTTFSNTSGIAGRSVSAFSFALNHMFGDGTPSSFKLTNVILHIATVLAAVLFSYILSRHLAPSRSRSVTLLLAATTSIVWALHPLHVSTVLYVVQRMTVLATLFSFLAVLVWIIARSAQTFTTKTIAFASSGLFIVLATLSKESGVLALAYIALFELLNPKGLARHPGTQAVSFATALSVVFIALSVLVISMPESIMGGYVLRDFDWIERLLTQPVVITEYLRQIALADVERMRFYYDSWPTIRTLGFPTLVGLVLLLCLALYSIAARHFDPTASFGIGLFLASHLLESTVVPLEHAFEHRNYIGSFGLILAACATLFHIANRKSRLVPAIALVLVISPIFLATRTASRVDEWSSSQILHSEAFRRAPDSFRAASALAQQKFWIEDDNEGALSVARQSLSYGPEDLDRHLLLSIYESLDGSKARFVDESLLQVASTTSVRRESTHLLFYIIQLAADGHSGIPGIADMTRLLDAINNNPDKRITKTERANLLMDHSDLLIRLDLRMEALVQVLKASVLMPDDPDVWIRVAKRQGAVGDFDEALLALNKARMTVDWRMPNLLSELDVVQARILEAMERHVSVDQPD